VLNPLLPVFPCVVFGVDEFEAVLCPAAFVAVVLTVVLAVVLAVVLIVVDADTLLDVLEIKVVEDSPGPTAPPIVVMFTKSPRKKTVLLFPQHAEDSLNSGAEQQ